MVIGGRSQNEIVAASSKYSDQNSSLEIKTQRKQRTHICADFTVIFDLFKECSYKTDYSSGKIFFCISYIHKEAHLVLFMASNVE